MSNSVIQYSIVLKTTNMIQNIYDTYKYLIFDKTWTI